jgi:hypothetical protein
MSIEDRVKRLERQSNFATAFCWIAYCIAAIWFLMTHIK